MASTDRSIGGSEVKTDIAVVRKLELLKQINELIKHYKGNDTLSEIKKIVIEGNINLQDSLKNYPSLRYTALQTACMSFSNFGEGVDCMPLFIYLVHEQGMNVNETSDFCLLPPLWKIAGGDYACTDEKLMEIFGFFIAHGAQETVVGPEGTHESLVCAAIRNPEMGISVLDFLMSQKGFIKPKDHAGVYFDDEMEEEFDAMRCAAGWRNLAVIQLLFRKNFPVVEGSSNRTLLGMVRENNNVSEEEQDAMRDFLSRRVMMQPRPSILAAPLEKSRAGRSRARSTDDHKRERDHSVERFSGLPSLQHGLSIFGMLTSERAAASRGDVEQNRLRREDDSSQRARSRSPASGSH